MKLRFSGIITLSLTFILLLGGVAYAGDGEEAIQEEETNPAFDLLGDISTARGAISFLFKLSEEGEDSPFFGRYYDPFEGDSFYLEGLSCQSWSDNNTLLRFDMGSSWNPSWSGSADWRRINQFYAFARVNDYHHFEIPTSFPAVRRDFEYGMETMNEEYGNLRLGYTYRDRSLAEDGIDLDAVWGTTDVLIAWDFPMGTWNGSFEYKYRELEDYRFDFNSAKHTTGTARLSHVDGNRNYYEVSMNYGVSDMDRGDNLSTRRFGGMARFIEPLGISDMNITSHIGWTNRDEGPSRIHPAGDEFDFDLEGRWKFGSNFRVHGSWDLNTADVSHVDEPTLFSFRTNPWPFAYRDTVFTQEVTTSEWNFGGRWDISRFLDLSADATWVYRGDLPLTDVHYVGTAPLQWDEETNYIFSLRYNPGAYSEDNLGNWLVRYEDGSRNNGNRISQSDDTRFSLNWNGQLSEELWLYIGGGFLNTEWTQPGSTTITQKGTEYGGGWNWYWGDEVRFFGDYWTYSVDGTWGYDQTTFMAGLGFEPDDEWELTLEFETVQGDFEFSPALDYDVEDFIVTASYRW